MKAVMITLALAVRVLIALATRTVFQPDEYFQALEPAHHAVFGYGHLTWEWLTAKPIRSIIYPSLNVPIYWFLKVTGLSEHPSFGDLLLIFCPRVIHGLLAALTDIALCSLTNRWLGRKYVSTALFLSLTSFFHALSLSRSLINSLETSLTTIALSLYPWDISHANYTSTMVPRSQFLKLLAVSALTCMLRPTNAILWLFLYGKLFWTLRSSRAFWEALNMTACTGVFALASLCLLDTTYYAGFKEGTIIFTPLNFLRTNLTSVSLFYGSNPWHYYLTQGLPILCTTALPFVLHGIYLVQNQHARPLRTMLGAVAWYIGVFSLMGHKEWRFIHPILPILHLFASKSLIDISSSTPGKSSKGKAKGKGKSNANHTKSTLLSYLPALRPAHLILLLLNVPISIYIVFFYCSAPITVLSYIRSLPSSSLAQGVGFLTPCHSTPGQAYIHRKALEGGVMWSLSCEPPVGGENTKRRYQDQTDVFFDSPREYMEKYFPSRVNPEFPVSLYPSTAPGSPLVMGDASTEMYPWRHEWPRHLVLFGQLLKHEGVKELLEEKGYKEVWKRGREWEGEGERKGGVRVWEWQG